jgi:predicted ester cyclase
MAANDNEDLIRRWLRMGEQGFAGDFHQYFTPDYTGHLGGQPTQSLDDLMRLERAFAAAFSRISYTVEDLFSIADKVVLRVTTCATHTGEFHGIAPTQRQVTMSGIVIYKVHAGRICESWGELDLLGLFRQLRAP